MKIELETTKNIKDKMKNKNYSEKYIFSIQRKYLQLME